MAFVKYTRNANSTASMTHVRLSGASITVTQAGQERFPQLAAAEFLSLYYNSEGAQIGLAPRTREDKDAFKFSRRGRGSSKVVAAARFLEQFGLRGQQMSTDGMLQEEGDLLVLGLQPRTTGPGRQRTGNNTTQPGARRGRKPAASSADASSADEPSSDVV